ncbi:hypothetical protein AGMMS49991_10350 [Spirochaetia bacterium]|nr:hypothetical protein AGMMS49991_10350 [Spirochaetia bacterium]
MMIDKLKEHIWIPEKIKKLQGLLMVIAALWMTVMVLLLMPQIRLFVFAVVEKFLLGRPLGNPSWSQKLFLSGLAGLCTPLVFFLSFVLIIKKPQYFVNEKARIAGIVLIAVSTVFIVWVGMYKAEWLLGDDSTFIATTAVNEWLPPNPMVNGRFWPIGQFHYNILVPLFRLLNKPEIPASAHLLVNGFIYALAVWFLYKLFGAIGPEKKHYFVPVLFLCIFPLFSVAFIPVFMDVIYSETILTLLLSAFMFFYYKAINTKKTVYYIAALLAAVYSTYAKEPVFGVFVIIGLTNFLFGFKPEARKDLIFNGILLLNAMVFIVLYYFLSYKNASKIYNVGLVEQNVVQSIFIILINNKFLILVLIAFFIRVFFVMVKKDRERLFSDALLFASVGYTVAYILLHLTTAYYFFPAVLLALPSFVYWAKKLLGNKNKFYAITLLFPLVLICALNLGEEIIAAKDLLKERQNTMPFVKELIADYESGKTLYWYEIDDLDAKNQIYQISRDWQKEVINLFCNYVNRTTDKKYLSESSEMPSLSEDVVFLYCKQNAHFAPISDDLRNLLQDHDFVLLVDFFGILVYKKDI